MAAPTLSNCSVSKNGNTYRYSGRISNRNTSYRYFYSSSDGGLKSEIASFGANNSFSFTLSSANTAYIYAYDGSNYSNVTTLAYVKNSTPTIVTGSEKVIYSYQCAGPTDDVKVEFSSEVTNETKLVVYYGLTTGWENSISYMYW